MAEPRALVVEDDPSWQAILREILEDCGLTVDVADSAEGAIELLRLYSHRLAVLDLSLGEMDHHNREGMNVLEAVRRLDPGCVPIFLTGFATVELAVDLIQKRGVFTCLRKEAFRRADFRQVVREALTLSPPRSLESEEGPTAAEPAGAGMAGVEPPYGEALVVEDDAGWRDLLSELLVDAGFQPQVCSSYVEALGWLRRGNFRLAVVDVSLASSLSPNENEDGYRLLAHTREAGVPTIIVSGYAEPDRIAAVYSEYDLFACLEKQSFDRRGFVETAQRAAAGEAVDADLAKLTRREREVLAMLGKGMTNKEIAQALYLSPNTVKRHIKAVFAKLGVNTRAAAAARGAGQKG